MAKKRQKKRIERIEIPKAMPEGNEVNQQHLREGRPEEKVFDKWFYSLAKDKQQQMRHVGCGPYREMALPRHSFPVYDNAKAFGFLDPRAEEMKPIEETWITGERVAEIIRDVVAMFQSSGNPVIDAHWDLVRIIMQMPDAPTQADLARRLGLTKQAISIRAKKLLVRASDVTPGLLDRVRMLPMPKDIARRSSTPGKESFSPPRLTRGATTTEEKRRNIKSA